MALIESIIARAKANKQRIVLPESLEERTLTAADKCLADDIADIILIGNKEEIFALAGKLGLKHVDKATIIDPATSEKTEEYAQLLFELRKKKGMTIEEARKQVLNPLYFGCLIIKSGDADGQISGALSTTGDTLRPALQIIKCAPGITCVSGAMLLITQTPQYGEEGVLVMGDVAVTLRRRRVWQALTTHVWQCSHSRQRVVPSMRWSIRWWRQPVSPRNSTLP